ncbi:hypothetical protein, partial [Komagataeibacter saccharivorans]|uniref:hypothetical protein n=1 Tax=Komagataeibacter saccharivorans TaxID=265959 RepID=UPI0039E8FAFA
MRRETDGVRAPCGRTVSVFSYLSIFSWPGHDRPEHEDAAAGPESGRPFSPEADGRRRQGQRQALRRDTGKG